MTEQESNAHGVSPTQLANVDLPPKQATHEDHIPLTHYVDGDDIQPQQFLKEVLKSHRELEIARRLFDQVSDPFLIDHIVFRIGAAERHLNYLFRTARERGISFEGRRWEWVSEEWRID